MSDIKLSDSFTIFFYVFRFKCDLLETISNNALWTRSRIKPDGNFLLNHIQHFFNINTKRSTWQLDKQNCTIFEIATDDLDTSIREKLLLYNSFFKRTHIIEVNGKLIDFSMCQDKSMLSPKLIMIPLAKIGILSFGIKLLNTSATIKNIQELNHQLRTFSSHHAIQIHTERKSHPRAYEQEQKIEDQLDQFIDTLGDKGTFHWNMNSWMDHLLSGFRDHLESFTYSNFQAFTYVNLKQAIKDIQLKEELFRLQRIYSGQIEPEKESLGKGNEIDQTFCKIFYGISLEGAAIAVLPDENPFLKNYSQTILNRSIWAFLLAYLQRYILLNCLEKTVSEVNSKSDIKDLRNHINEISNILFHFNFNEFSNNTYQQDYYKFCLKNLNIDNLRAEVKEKIEYLEKFMLELRKEEESKILDDASQKNQYGKKKRKGLFG